MSGKSKRYYSQTKSNRIANDCRTEEIKKFKIENIKIIILLTELADKTLFNNFKMILLYRSWITDLIEILCKTK